MQRRYTDTLTSVRMSPTSSCLGAAGRVHQASCTTLLNWVQQTHRFRGRPSSQRDDGIRPRAVIASASSWAEPDQRPDGRGPAFAIRLSAGAGTRRSRCLRVFVGRPHNRTITVGLAVGSREAAQCLAALLGHDQASASREVATKPSPDALLAGPVSASTLRCRRPSPSARRAGKPSVGPLSPPNRWFGIGGYVIGSCSMTCHTFAPCESSATKTSSRLQHICSSRSSRSSGLKVKPT